MMQSHEIVLRRRHLTLREAPIHFQIQSYELRMVATDRTGPNRTTESDSESGPRGTLTV